MRFSSKIILQLLFCLTVSSAASATNWYARPNGPTYGNATGTDWSNAWSGFSNIANLSVVCGDTVWLAGGTYTQTLSISGKNCTTTNPLVIKRVQASDAVASLAAGWNNNFDSQVVISNSNPGINIPSSNSVVIDGRISDGIQVQMLAGGGDGIKAATSSSINDLRLYHIEFLGPSCAPAGNCTTGAYGINIAPSTNTVSNLLVNNCAVHRVSEAFRASNWSNSVIEYSNLYDISNDGVDHEDTMYSYPSTNVTMRYNKIYNVPNDGIFFEFGGAVNFRLYGNVIYASTFSILTTKSPGSYGPIYIYNNSFHAPSSSSYGFIQLNGVTAASQVRNNVFYNVSNGSGGATSDHNAYNYTTLNGYAWPSGEAGSITFTGDGGMSNIAAGDAHLSSTSILRNKGAALDTDGFVNKDMDGNTRGADGGWDIGAFEFSMATSSTLAAPKNLRVIH